MQWLLLTPQNTGRKPIHVAERRMKTPINPVNRKTSIVIIAMVSVTINEYGALANFLANIFPIESVKKYEREPANMRNMRR